MAKVKHYGNTRTQPVWADDFLDRDHVMPFPAKVDPAQFSDQAGVIATVGVSGAAQDATSIPVAALAPSLFASTVLIAQGNVLIPAGTVLYFGASKKFAKLTADAVYGATSLTVQALPTALVSGDVATYSRYGTLSIPSGTVVGRTYAERDANTAFGPGVVTDDELFLSVYDIANANEEPDVELYRPGSVVKQNYLPGYTLLNTAVDEVQTINFTNSPAGTFRIRATDLNGVEQETQLITYSGTAATLVTNINAALDAVFGSGLIVASGSAVTAIAVTFSGAGYTAVAQPSLLKIEGDTMTAGDWDVTRTTKGGKAMLTLLQSKYQCIKGTD